MTYTNFEGEMPAHLAARKSFGCMKLFVDAGFDLNTEGPKSRTVLHIAVQSTSIEVAEYLLGKKEARMVSILRIMTGAHHCTLRF